MWKGRKVHDEHRLGSGERRGSEQAGPFPVSRRGQPAASSRLPRSPLHRSSSQPLIPPTSHDNHMSIGSRPKPPTSTRFNTSAHRFSLSRGQKPITQSPSPSWITNGISRGRSASVHQLRQSVQEPSWLRSLERGSTSEKVDGYQRLGASPTSTSDSVTLNGDEDAVFESSDDDSGNEGEEEEEEEEEERGGEEISWSNIPSAGQRDLSKLLHQHYYRADSQPPSGSFPIRQDRTRIQAKEETNQDCSRAMYYARTGSFSTRESSTARQTRNSMIPSLRFEGSKPHNSRIILRLEHLHNNPPEPRALVRPPLSISQSGSSINPHHLQPTDLSSSDWIDIREIFSVSVGEESEEDLQARIMWLKEQIAQKRIELDQLSAGVKHRQRKAVAQKRDAACRSPDVRLKERWRRMASRLEGEFALKNSEAEKLTAALNSLNDENSWNGPQHPRSESQYPQRLVAGRRMNAPSESLNRTSISSWKDWGTGPYSRTYSMACSSRESTVSSSTTRSTVTSLFSRLPSGSSVTEDSVHSESESETGGEEEGDAEDPPPARCIVEESNNKSADVSNKQLSEIIDGQGILEDTISSMLDEGEVKSEVEVRSESVGHSGAVGEENSFMEFPPTIEDSWTSGERDAPDAQRTEKPLSPQDGHEAESPVTSDSTHEPVLPVLAMPMPIRGFPCHFHTLESTYDYGQADAEDPPSLHMLCVAGSDIDDNQATVAKANNLGARPHLTITTEVSPKSQLSYSVINDSAFDRFEVFMKNWVEENPSFTDVIFDETKATFSTNASMALAPRLYSSTQPDSYSTSSTLRNLDLSLVAPTNNALHLTISEDHVPNENASEDESYDYFDEYFNSDGVVDVEGTNCGKGDGSGDEKTWNSDVVQYESGFKAASHTESKGISRPNTAKVQFAENTSSPSPHKRTPAQLLESVLRERPHLNLTGKVEVTYEKAINLAFGGFADVYRGFVANGNKFVAVKRLRLNVRASEKVTKDLAKELRIWSELDHPNVLPLLGYILHVGTSYPSLVSEWMEDGSLRDCMKDLKRYEALSMVLGIAKGLAYLHSKDIIHSDLKSDNVLVSPEKKALLTDFGISQMTSLSTGYSSDSVKGSGRWQAMEFFTLREEDDPPPLHTVATDVWSFGMTIYELLSFDFPYAHIKDRDQVTLVISRGYLPKFPTYCADSTGLDRILERTLWSICQRCWNGNPEERPGVSTFVEELEVIERCKDMDSQKYLSKLLDTFRNA